MKILYISNFRDGTGYSVAATNYVLAMAEAGLDVVCRNISFNNRNNSVDDRLQVLLDKDSKDCNVCITHSLPKYFIHDGRFEKNIGLFAFETDSLEGTGWLPYLNCMDEVWVISDFMKYHGIEVPIKVIPHCFEPAAFNYNYSREDDRGTAYRLKQETGCKLYYTIGEAVKRKNLADTVKGFQLAFQGKENVQLLIKTSLPGHSPEEANRKVREYLATVKRGMGIFTKPERYREEIIITDYWADCQVMQLHQEADCFVQTSYGEAFSIPAFTAAAMGNEVIVPEGTAFQDYQTERTRSIKTTQEVVYGVNDSIPGLYNSNQYWHKVNVGAFAYLLRNSYNDWRSNKCIKKCVDQKLLSRFSYENIGNLIKATLHGTTQQKTS